MMIVFGGLPGTGKSTIARVLAAELNAVWLRVDSIEQAIHASGVLEGDLKDAGYRVAYAIAEDNLRLGMSVIGDSVNGWMSTRDAWRDVGLRSGTRVLEVETICSDVVEHRHRVETRRSEVPGLVLPGWQAVLSRDYHPWTREHVTLDTASGSVDACVGHIRSFLQHDGSR